MKQLNIKLDTMGFPIKKINKWLTADIDEVVMIDSKKSTLIEEYELDMYLLIRELVQKHPNDMKLGGLIRQVINKKISKESDLSGSLKYRIA